MIRKVFFYLLVPEVFLGDFLHVREDKPRESGKKSCQLRHKNSTLRDSFSPLPGRGAGVGGSTQQIFVFLYGEAPLRCPAPYPFIYHFSRKRYSYTFYWQMVPLSYIPCLELCIPSALWALSQTHMTDFPTLQRVKSLPFHITEAWKRYPFGAEPPRIGLHREYPLSPGPLRGSLSPADKSFK